MKSTLDIRYNRPGWGAPMTFGVNDPGSWRGLWRLIKHWRAIRSMER
jgi:hypothetical protein